MARLLSLATDFVLDPLKQAIYERCGHTAKALAHYSDRGTQYCQCPTRTGWRWRIAPSVGSRGGSYDKTLAESIIGLRPGSFDGSDRGGISRPSHSRRMHDTGRYGSLRSHW
jgi:hypothetical protein